MCHQGHDIYYDYCLSQQLSVIDLAFLPLYIETLSTITLHCTFILDWWYETTERRSLSCVLYVKGCT